MVTTKEKDIVLESDVLTEEAADLPVATPIHYEDQLVTIQLFRDNERYKEDLLVIVNGRSFLIKRGVPVEVPRYVADVIEKSQRQDSMTDAMMMRLEEEYERATQEKTKPYAG